MCGIVSLTYRDENPDMGREASELLKRLEYRGYDSTGASFIGADGKVSLAKKVGAPSKVVRELSIPSYSGQRFIGQVRWATYGAVTDVNSQPHHVRCKVEMVGAHNGNISNTDALKSWLAANGHAVVSDNDGEMITHVCEEFYAANLADPQPALAAMRRALSAAAVTVTPPEGALLLIDAARKADAKGEGSYAAAFADPRVPGTVAVKSGSSLYAGIGADARGDFVVVSSDLTSVLSKTRMLIPLSEGEGLWFTEREYVTFSLSGEPEFACPKPKRSKLNVHDTALKPPYKHYMEQEIASSPENIDEIVRYYFRDAADDALFALLEERKDDCKAIAEKALDLYNADEDGLKDAARAIAATGECRAIESKAKSHLAARARGPLVSDERAMLADVASRDPGSAQFAALLDAIFVWKKRRKVTHFLVELMQEIRETGKRGGRVYLVASGTSNHAALVGAYFFNNHTDIAVYPCNPGTFRSAYFSSLSARDLVIGITQSGETKDLVDVFTDVRDKDASIRRACLVNNENSRIPQELSDFYLPILCGPEIAVAATKSFVNQIVILYLLAASFDLPEAEVISRVRKVKTLLEDSLRVTERAIEETARMLCMRPSIHILGTGLIGLAREGALKIREVVLNHAEGYDAAEFKHGPNTILGKNTVFSVDEVARAAAAVAKAAASGAKVSEDGYEALRECVPGLESLFSNYPLVFVCPPDDRDVRITISQIHTHKIRGADVILIAEKHQDLAAAATGRPSNDERYRSVCVELPYSGDKELFVFGAALALQRLAFRMSVLKMERLDSLGVAEHGVHPDSPKNVSKSITVD
jgi:glucosamine 6-phosphate synthetase-like amidotransferase/phosphosugar isomerase protein